MYITIVFWPLVNAFVCGLFGRFLGFKASAFSSKAIMIIVLLNSFFIFMEVCWLRAPVFISTPLNWIISDCLDLNWGLLFDPLTSIMLVVVSTISFLVHLYSIEYIGQDPHFVRFMSYISLFTFFMFVLITANNILQMFVGWEGVGLCSYLLINFWFTRIQANKAAIKAMLINRVGDLALSIGIFACFVCFSSLHYSSVFSSAPYYTDYTLNIFYFFSISIVDFICFFLFLGAMGKSAQLGLHTWLPDAMEGPTPVSALIHAATMVTAGVFFLARCSPLFEFAPLVLAFICCIGALTAFFAATTGLVQNDLKKVIAYSTCSQLGYMVFACGLSCYHVGVFHLYNHAFFKALLFLGAGSVIHGVADEQDMRRMGGLKRLLPYTYSVMLIGSLALMGFPFLSGFYSKDVILEAAYSKYSIIGLFAFFLGLFAAFCTSFYSIRLLYLTFLAEPSGFRKVIVNSHESPWQMTLPLGILAFLSIFIGFLSKDLFIGLGTDFWNNSIFILPNNYSLIAAEFIPSSVKILPLIVSITGALFSFVGYLLFSNALFNLKKSLIGKALYNFWNRKWFFDKFYSEFFVQPMLNFSYFFSYKMVDRGVIEIFGPKGITSIIKEVQLVLFKLQSGLLFHSSIMLITGYLFFFSVALISPFDFTYKNLLLICLFKFFISTIQFNSNKSND